MRLKNLSLIKQVSYKGNFFFQYTYFSRVFNASAIMWQAIKEAH